MFKQFKKVDGYYWVKQYSGCKIGYKSLHEMFVDEFYYAWIGIGFLALSALLQLVLFVIRFIK